MNVPTPPLPILDPITLFGSETKHERRNNCHGGRSGCCSLTVHRTGDIRSRRGKYSGLGGGNKHTSGRKICRCDQGAHVWLVGIIHMLLYRPSFLAASQPARLTDKAAGRRGRLSHALESTSFCFGGLSNVQTVNGAYAWRRRSVTVVVSGSTSRMKQLTMSFLLGRLL